jgi:hypothetical protein
MNVATETIGSEGIDLSFSDPDAEAPVGELAAEAFLAGCGCGCGCAGSAGCAGCTGSVGSVGCTGCCTSGSLACCCCCCCCCFAL